MTPNRRAEELALIAQETGAELVHEPPPSFRIS